MTPSAAPVCVYVCTLGGGEIFMLSMNEGQYHQTQQLTGLPAKAGVTALASLASPGLKLHIWRPKRVCV